MTELRTEVDLIGRQLGCYRIDGKLGQGGMSVLYRATDLRLGRKVALKVIGDHLGADAEFRERFVDEARNTAAIDHPNVVPLYDFGEADGLHYIGMRLVDGSDLARVIAAGPLDPRRTLRLLEQVADALDAVHRLGLVHLDVKPANVLVTRRESAAEAREHVYLADFGLTRRGSTGYRTRAGDFFGSPSYAAPEHLRGEPLDGRSDQYGLAGLLFACLTGTPPYRGEVPDVIAGHLNAPPPSVTHVRPSLPAEIDAVVARGMAKDPVARYRTCAAFVAAAHAAFDDPRPAGGGRHERWVRVSGQPLDPADPVRLRPPVPAGGSPLALPAAAAAPVAVYGVVAALVLVILVLVAVVIALAV